MIEPFTILSLVLIFVSLYFSVVYLLLYLKNRKYLYDEPGIPKKLPKISILVPAFNEEKTIAATLDSVVALHYPKNLLEVIIINDGSTDKTAEISRQYARKYKYIKLLDKPNTGKADSLNQGLKIAKGKLFCVLDSDSYIHPDALYKSVGFFEDEKVASVIFPIRPQNTRNFIEKLQYVEYVLASWIKNIFQYTNIIFATHGVGCMYRTDIVKKLGGFDTKCITEDIEIAWRLHNHNYIIKSAFFVMNSTEVPATFKKLWNQRIRWMLGLFQVLFKYKSPVLKLQSNRLVRVIYPYTLITYLSLFIGFFLILHSFLSYFSDVILTLYYQIITEHYILHFYFNFLISGLTALTIGLLILSSIFIYYSFKNFHLNIKEYKAFFILFLFMMPFFSFFVAAASIYKILRKDIRWFK